MKEHKTILEDLKWELKSRFSKINIVAEADLKQNALTGLYLMIHTEGNVAIILLNGQHLEIEGSHLSPYGSIRKVSLCDPNYVDRVIKILKM